MNLAKNIKALRLQKGLTKIWLAKYLEYKNYQSITAIETSAAEPPISKLIKLSELFSVTIDALIKKDLTKGVRKPAAVDKLLIKTMDGKEFF